MKITVDNYIENVLRTLASTNKPTERLQDSKIIDLLHGAIGISTEAGELLDVLKKHIYYGTSIDEINMMEECSDLLYYIGVILSRLGYTFEEVMQINIEKLQARYPEKFTSENAINRDLEKERKILEK